MVDLHQNPTVEVARMHTDHRFTGPNHWQQAVGVNAARYRCGYCSADVGSGSGWQTEAGNVWVRICPHCNGPTFFAADGSQWPGAKEGAPISNLPPDVQAIYEEARSGIAANAFTGTVMLCRKLLMHTAVGKGAEENKSFQHYVQWLIDEHYAPRGAEVWLDYIRARANDANHEIVVMTKDDAVGVLRFTEALLRGVYELPNLVPSPKAQEESEADESG